MIKIISRSFILFIAIIMPALPAYSTETIVLDSLTGSYPVGKYLEIMEDAGGNISLQDILSGNIAGKFTRSVSQSPGYGFTDSVFWVRFRVLSKAENNNWLLELDFPLMDRISLFVPDEAGGGYVEKKYGYSLPFSGRDVMHRNFVFKLPLKKGIPETFYLRFENADRMEFPLIIWAASAFQEKDHIEEFILGMYYGILFVMALFNFLLFISIKDKTYLYYVMYIAAFSVYQLNQNGLLYEFIYPDFLNNHIVHYINIIMLPCIILFVQNFLNLKTTLPRADRIFTVLKYLFLLSFLPSFFMSYAASIIMINVVMLVFSAAATIITGTILLLRGYRPAKFFMIAWSMFITGAVIYSLKVYGLLPNNYFTSYSIQIGSVFEVILLSLGLGDRINILRDEKEEAQKNIIITQKQALDVQTKMTNAFSRFVPKEFLTFLNKKSIVEVELGNQVQKQMSVLFSDIRSFTSLSEMMTPQENFNFLNSYLKRIGPIIRSNGGFIDKYIGDAVMALFPGSPDQAVDTALLMQNSVLDYNSHRKSSGYAEIEIGIGIHAGSLMLGTIGEENRMEGTVISDDVNLASRIESLTKFYGTEILISGSLFDMLPDPSKYLYRIIDTVIVKGRREPVTLIEILDERTTKNFRFKIETKSRLSEAIELYRETSVREALKIYEDLSVQSKGADGVIEIYIKRCRNLISSGIPENFNGIEKLDRK